MVVFMTIHVFGATPSCGTNLASGTHVFDSDLTCVGARAFAISLNDNVVVDCDGYTVTARDIEIGEVSNIEIKNCNFQMTPTGEALSLYAYNLSVHDNTIDCYGGRMCIAFYGWDNPPKYGMDVVFANNDITMYNQTIGGTYGTRGMIDILYEDFAPNLIMTSNNISNIDGGDFIYRWWDYDTFGNPDTINVNNVSTTGNHYNISWWDCVDADFDGFCDTSFVEVNSVEDNQGRANGTVIDNYPLSEYYWNPYVAPNIPPSSVDTTFTYDESDIPKSIINMITVFLITTGLLIPIIAGFVGIILLKSYLFKKL